jgi:transposase
MCFTLANGLEGAMASAVRLREDYDARQLRALAKASRDADQTRRLLALAAISEGSSRGAAAAIGGVGLQTVRDWVLAFNADGPEGLIDGKAPGKAPLLNAAQCEVLKRIVEAGPNPAVDGVVRWRLVDLAQWVHGEFRVSVSKQTLSRVLRAMGYRKLSARPRHHAQDPAAPAVFKKSFRRAWRQSGSAMRPAGR